MVESSKKTRKATRLRDLAISRLGDPRVPIDINHQMNRVSGPNHAKFVSYLGVLTQSKVLILVSN